MGHLEGGNIKLKMTVNYPDLSDLANSSTIGDVWNLPTAAYPAFWGWIMAALFFIFTFSMYQAEKRSKGEGKMLSSMAVSALICIVLTVLGSLVGFISLEIMTYILVLGLLIIAIWFFSS